MGESCTITEPVLKCDCCGRDIPEGQSVRFYTVGKLMPGFQAYPEQVLMGTLSMECWHRGQLWAAKASAEAVDEPIMVGGTK